MVQVSIPVLSHALKLIKVNGIVFKNSLNIKVRVCTNIRTMADKTDSNFQSMLKQCSKVLAPSLKASSHKGQAGKIGVVGGSLEYTGAPYFAAISALKVGADLAHVFCTRDAAIPIKCYSPELIVHPILDSKNYDALNDWLRIMDVIVIGPGLGRNVEIFAIIEKIIQTIKEIKTTLIIDADGLFLISQKPQLLNGFDSEVILTPNRMEWARLLGFKSPSELDNKNPVNIFEKHGWNKNIFLLVKGENDEIISMNKKVILKELGGSNRRCGGQGDILSGTLAVFLNWSKRRPEHKPFVACYAACNLVRQCNAFAFYKKGRSMTSTDMLEEIHNVFEEDFEERN